MDLLTWGDIKQDIQETHGIETDASYTEQELINMYNKAQTIIESEVIKLQQDYFLAKTSFAVTKGITTYDLPSDIYGYKIRRTWWEESGLNKQKLWRATNLDDMERELTYYQTNYNKKLRYIILNPSAGNAQLELSYSENDATIIMYYTRNPIKFTVNNGDSQVCDIPEFADAIKAHMSYQIEWKDKSPTLEHTKQDFKEMLSYLTNSLAVSVNDEDTMIEPDTELFDEHV